MKTPTLIITNELDYRVPVDQGLQMFTALRRQSVPAEMIVFPDEGHWVLKALNSKVLARAGLRLDEALARRLSVDAVV